MLKPKKSKKPTKLSPQEQYWNQVDQQSRELITNTFAHSIVEEAYQDYLEDYQEESENLPENPQELAQELAYEYLLGLSQDLLNRLSQFSCHNLSYFEELIQSYE